MATNTTPKKGNTEGTKAQSPKPTQPKVEKVQESPSKDKVESPVEKEKVPVKETPKAAKQDYEIVPLQGGKYELRLNLETGYKVFKRGSKEKCENYLNQLQK